MPMMSDSPVEPAAMQIDSLPASLSSGSTVLVASAIDPSQYGVGLHLLATHGTGADTALVVTTTAGVAQTIESYENFAGETEQPSLGIVDMTSKQQSVSALYGEIPVVFTPSPSDLERLVVAFSELSRDTAPANGERHLVVRSLTPVLSAVPTPRVCTVLERITGLRSQQGLCLLGLDYTAHDEETIASVADHVDGVLWVTHPSSNQLEFDYQPSKKPPFNVQ